MNETFDYSNNPFAHQMDPEDMNTGFNPADAGTNSKGSLTLKKQLTFPAEVESDAEGHVMLFHFLKPEKAPATPAFGVFRPPSMPASLSKSIKGGAFGASKNLSTMALGSKTAANVQKFTEGFN